MECCREIILSKIVTLKIFIDLNMFVFVPIVSPN